MIWREVRVSGPVGQQNGNLPAETSSFVGRHRELSEVRLSLKSSRLVTITGMGGVGKTRLALRAAGELSRRFHDGAWLAELSSASRPGVLPWLVADVLGLHDRTARRRVDMLAQQMADKHLLLVPDTCEHLVSACGALAERLLQAAPHLRVITTSRQPLGISGERVLMIEPLNPPRPEAGTDLLALRRNDAVALFAERASAIVPGFAVNQRNSAAVVALCRRLDGVPLALELAAVRLRALSIEQLARELDSGRRLGVARRGGVARHRTMRAAVGWSHRFCTPAERLAWARLSVFAGDFGLAAAQAMCASPGAPAGTRLSVIESLVDKSILRAHDRGGEVRYRMPGAIREYGRERLRECGEETRLRRLHRDWCLRLARQAEREWCAGGQADVFRRTEAEHASLQDALEFSFATPDERHTGLDLAARLWFYWAGCGRLGEGRYWLDRGIFGAAAVRAPGNARREVPACAAASIGQAQVWARALWASGHISLLQGNMTSAVSVLEACKELTTATGYELALAKSVHSLGSAALICGDHPRATALLTEALARYEELGERSSIVFMARVGLAVACVFGGDPDAAAAICAQVQRGCEAVGERWACAYAGYVTALTAWIRRDHPGALLHSRECLRSGAAVHDLVAIVLAIELIALLSVRDGDPGSATVLLGAASHIWPSVGRPQLGSPHHTGLHGECLRRAKQALTEREFAAAFDYGARLSLDRAVACALGRASIPASARPASAGPASAGPASARRGSADFAATGIVTGISPHTGGPMRMAGDEPLPAGAIGSGTEDPDGQVRPAEPAEPAEPASLPGPIPPVLALARGKRPSPWPPLSHRECQVAGLVADGLCNREIAQRLAIAKRTADAHVEHVLAKLTFSSRAQIAAWVARRRARADRAGHAGGGGVSSAQRPARPSTGSR